MAFVKISGRILWSLDFSTVPNGCEKSAVLETRADLEGFRTFEAASTNYVSRRASPQPKIKRAPTYRWYSSNLVGEDGFA